MTIWPGMFRRAAVLAPSLAVATGLAVALYGCATPSAQPSARATRSSQPAASATKTSKPADTTLAAPTAGSPRQRADQDAAHIIASFPVPAGALRSGRSPSPRLSGPTQEPDSPDLVMVTRWWTAPGQPEAVLAWVQAHLRPGFALTSSGSSGTGSDIDERFDEFSLPALTNVLTQRSLLVTVTADGRGQTAIRVDAQVIWLPAKPAAERIPSGVRVVTVTPEFNDPPGTHGPGRDHAFAVTSPARIAAIAAAVDRLPVYPPGAQSCGPNANVEARLVFRLSPHDPAAAVVDTNGPCAAISVTIDGRKMPTLRDITSALIREVLAIAGVSWPYDPGL